MHTAIIVDDEPITRMDLGEMLTEQGFQVLGSVGDGFDAIELCRKVNPDVVMMDVRMPVFDGLTAAETILNEKLAQCVVLVTAMSDRDLIERANQIGVTGYLVKPVEERLLLPTVEVALAQSRRIQALQAQLSESREQVEQAKLIERAKAILAAQRSISEAEAYAQLRRMSMDKRCSIASLAQAVVKGNSQREVIARAKELLIHQKGLSEAEAYRWMKQKAEQRGITQLQLARELLAAAR